MYRIFYLFAFLTSLFIFSCSDDTNINSDEKNNNTTKGIVELIKDKNTQSLTFMIEGFSDNWKIYSGKSINTIDKTKSILEGKGNGIYKLDLDNSSRSYFELVTSTENYYFAENHLPMAGGYNYRDLGGIKTKDNRTIKWGKIFRSDDMNLLTDNDLQYLSSIPLTSIVDFRYQEEIDKAPDRIPSSVSNIYQLSIMPGNLFNTSNLAHYTKNQLDSLMQQLNVLLVTDKKIVETYKEFFTLVQDESKLPLLYHCSAGKDRTGMSTALLLYGLGVDESIIIKDYLSSNEYLADKYSKYVDLYPNLESLYMVKQQFLSAGINQIKTDYGSVQNYLVQVLYVDLQKLKDIYLQ